MPINKSAFIRYKTLDGCFRNGRRKRITFQNLLEAVNESLEMDNSNSKGIKARQLRKDIQFMRSMAGWEAPIEVYNEDGTFYYRYEDTNFSIANNTLTDEESESMRNALEVMQRFEGQPEFEWMHEVYNVLRDKLRLGASKKPIISYETNIDYVGHKWITPLYNHIYNKTVVEVKYTPFGKEQMVFEFHPHHLRQYNNRWFVIGYNATHDLYNRNFSLDRIDSVRTLQTTYKEDDHDWNVYFSDIIGVSVPENGILEQIALKFNSAQAPYISTKPLHESQHAYPQDDGSLLVHIKVIPNFELEQLLLSFGERVEILKPEDLRLKIEGRVKLAVGLYS